ncbi:MAG TPA: hypothetical protein VN445_07210 [Rectinemataceae bacterium]|nr:hypothetical protein [Rectinemataceae bacterium]
MRIAVVAVSDKKSEKLQKLARAVSREFSLMGHVSDFLEAVDFRLSTYDFLVICSEPSGLGSGIGKKLGEQLSNGGNLVGKRSMSLLLKSGLLPQKALAIMMKTLEKEGMIVTMGEVVANDGESIAAAREAPLIRG